MTLLERTHRGSIVLTDEQRAAVEWADRPLMVLAGAGTGKTTVVVERVRQDGLSTARHLIEDIYEVEAHGIDHSDRLLFSSEGKKGRILLGRGRGARRRRRR